jgi:hypothetical protein
MEHRDYYYARAADCLQAAQRASAPEVQQAYLDIMKHYIEFAELAAQLDEETQEGIFGKDEGAGAVLKVTSRSGNRT